MRKIALAAVVSIVLPLFCYAHDHSTFLRPGEIIFGYNIYPMAGNLVNQSFHDNDGTVESVTAIVFTPACRTAWAGDAVSFEVAILDGLSLGLKTNLVQMLVYQIRDGIWDVQGAVFGTAYLNSFFGIPDGFPLKFFWNQELQFAPIYTTQPSFGDGLMNMFTTLSGNFGIVDTDFLRLSAYIDFKAITSFLHPYYTFRWMTETFYRESVTGFGLTPSEDFHVIFNPGTKLITAVGVDLILFKNFLLFIGLNIPVVSFGKDENDSVFYEWGVPAPMEELFGLDRWEFELKFKL